MWWFLNFKGQRLKIGSLTLKNLLIFGEIEDSFICRDPLWSNGLYYHQNKKEFSILIYFSSSIVWQIAHCVFFFSSWTDGLRASAWLGGKLIKGNWTWLGQSPSLIDVKKWKLTETPEKEEYCLLAKCYDTIDSGIPSCLHGVNCTANFDWNQQGGSEIGYICEQEANLLEYAFW